MVIQMQDAPLIIVEGAMPFGLPPIRQETQLMRTAVCMRLYVTLMCQDTQIRFYIDIFICPADSETFINQYVDQCDFADICFYDVEV